MVHETQPPRYFFVGEADLAFDENGLPPPMTITMTAPALEHQTASAT